MTHVHLKKGVRSTARITHYSDVVSDAVHVSRFKGIADLRFSVVSQTAVRIDSTTGNKSDDVVGFGAIILETDLRRQASVASL